MIGLRGMPGPATAEAERALIARRLTALLTEIDRLEAGDEVTADRLGLQLDDAMARLAALTSAPIDEARKQRAFRVANADLFQSSPASVREQLGAARTRLRRLVVAACSLPPGCVEANATFREAVRIELRRIGRLHAERQSLSEARAEERRSAKPYKARRGG